MNKKVKSLVELEQEKARLNLKKASLEDSIKQRIKDLPHDFNPVNIIKRKFLDAEARSKLARKSGILFLDFIIARFLFKRSSFIKKLLIALLIRKGQTYLSNRINSMIPEDVPV